MRSLVIFEVIALGALLFLGGRWQYGQQKQAGARVRSWLGLAMVLAGLLLNKCWIQVPPATVAASYDPLRGGIQAGDYGEGWQLVPPWATIRYFSVRTQPYTMSSLPQEGGGSGKEDAITCQTSEGLGLNIECTVLYHISPGDANRLWKNVGPNYEAVIVRPNVREAARIIISSYPVMSVYSNAPAQTDGIPGIDFFPGRRQEVADKIFQRVQARMAEKGVTLERFLMRNVDYLNPEFESSIVQKQIAQQNIVTQQYEAEIQHVRAKANIVRAEGDAEAIRLTAAALAVQPRVIQWEMVQKLPANIDVVILPDKSMPVVRLDQTQGSDTAGGGLPGQ
jgi:regulator of protease activity HflC (stomatin/prohibitin superfamily)